MIRRDLTGGGKGRTMPDAGSARDAPIIAGLDVAGLGDSS
jgi:hypothetical protein